MALAALGGCTMFLPWAEIHIDKDTSVSFVKSGAMLTAPVDQIYLGTSVWSSAAAVEKPYGTGHRLYSPDFSMAGKTGTAQKNYVARDPQKLAYISTFAGYFPADDPKYSCIVVIHEPDKSVGYYGADVSGPVFKSIAQKIYANNPLIDKVKDLEPHNLELEEAFEQYYAAAQKKYDKVPNVKGMSGMDAISILENLGLQVEVRGNGKVRKQSIPRGTDLRKVRKIVLELS
jgi:cell division protein FtsI (penicillin-binding protein 3)